MTSIGYALARAALIRTLTAYSGITTSDGEADGTTLVDSNLKGRNDFISEKTILIMSGDAKDEDKGATDFDNTDGKITLQGTGFSAQIKAGTIFRVLNISSIEIDVARIEAKIDTIDVLVDALEGKLDDGTYGLSALNTDLDTLLTRLSAAKSSYLNELAPAHMPADLDTLKTRLSDYRAGLLNYLTELGAAHIPADIDTLKARLTAARASNLDYLTELAAAHIPADIDTLKTYCDILDDATNGLANIKSLIDGVGELGSGILVQVPFYVTTQTVKNSSITLFALDALGCTIREVYISFYLAADAVATFTPTWHKTRAGDLVTFTQEAVPTLAQIVNPANARVYSYKLGEIAQGLQGEFRLAQDNAGNANNAVDAFCVVSMIL